MIQERGHDFQHSLQHGMITGDFQQFLIELSIERGKLRRDKKGGRKIKGDKTCYSLCVLSLVRTRSTEVSAEAASAPSSAN